MNILTSLNEELSQITPTRSFNLLYIILDSIFILFLIGLLIYKKRYQTLVFGVFGGVLYTIVDYCGFYLIAHSREIYIDNVLANSGMTFLVLLWMSMSYGLTNFVFIWLCLAKDKYLPLWLFLIIGWWICAPIIATVGGPASIMTTRTTNEYHFIMGIILILSYFALIVIMLIKKKMFVNLIHLNLIGISVQFCWEFALLINGIRPLNNMSLQTIIVNSLVETNLGMPGILLIFYLFRKYFQEDFKKVNDLSECEFGILKLK